MINIVGFRAVQNRSFYNLKLRNIVTETANVVLYCVQVEHMFATPHLNTLSVAVLHFTVLTFTTLLHRVHPSLPRHPYCKC